MSRSASKAEIRRAYLDLARRHHPDLNSGSSLPGSSGSGASGSGDPTRGTSGRSLVGIREINAAWDVLGDTTRRADYDRALAAGRSYGHDDVSGGSGWWGTARRDSAGTRSNGFRTTADGSTTESNINRPKGVFTPYDSGPDPTEGWRHSADSVNDATVPPRLLLAAPPLLFVVGAALVIAWLVIGVDALLAAGSMALFFSFLFFVGAPLVAMARSQNEEVRARRRR